MIFPGASRCAESSFCLSSVINHHQQAAQDERNHRRLIGARLLPFSVMLTVPPPSTAARGTQKEALPRDSADLQLLYSSRISLWFLSLFFHHPPLQSPGWGLFLFLPPPLAFCSPSLSLSVWKQSAGTGTPALSEQDGVR